MSLFGHCHSTSLSPPSSLVTTDCHVPLSSIDVTDNLTCCRLHGEKPLAQENFNRSSQAYDQSLLSKIGKTGSPPHHRSDSTDTTPLTQKLSLQTRDPKSHQRLRVAELPSAPMDSARWISSPTSAAVSPGSRPAWRDYNMGHPSPSNDSTTPSLVLDPELFLQSRSISKPSTTGAVADDSISVESRSQRGSYDQAMFGSDQDFTHEDGQHTLERRASGQGIKRRAHSPPTEAVRDDRSPAYSNELYQKVTNAARSPASAYRAAPSYGSVSSTASSVRQGSYASSFAPSIAASSMTSVSSLDRPSPSDPYQAHAFITSAGPVSSPATSIPPSRKMPIQQLPQDNRSIARKMSIQTAVNEPRPAPVTKLGGFYICECCPKKPRKFETEEDLRQVWSFYYKCLFCPSSSDFAVHVSSPSNPCSSFISMLTFALLDRTTWKSNTHASIAPIVSRTRTKLKDTKIHYT